MKVSQESLKSLQNKFLDFKFLEPYARRLEELISKLEKGLLNVVFVGEFNAGKTSLINALFNLNLPTNILPETASIWRIFLNQIGENHIIVHLLNGENIPVETYEKVKEYDPKQIKYIDVILNSSDFDGGLVIVDTPGLSSLNENHKKVLDSFISEADVILLTLDSQQPLTKSLKTFVEEKAEFAERIYAIINKADKKPKASIEELKNYIREEFGGFINNVIATSAKKGELQELRDLLKKISDEKREILLSSLERRVKQICRGALEVVEYQLENEKLDLTELTKKKNQIENEILKLEEEIRRQKRNLDSKLRIAIENATREFEKTVRSNVDTIIEALYDRNLEESIEDAFDKVIKNAVEASLRVLEKDLGRLSEDLALLGNKLAEEHNIGRDISIKVAEGIVKFREEIIMLLQKILEIIEFIKRIKTLQRIINVLKLSIQGIIFWLATELFAKGLTKHFVRQKVLSAIDDVVSKYRVELENIIFGRFEEIFSEISKDLMDRKESYEKAYREILQERQKSIEEFNNYMEKLRNLRNELKLCGGV